MYTYALHLQQAVHYLVTPYNGVYVVYGEAPPGQGYLLIFSFQLQCISKDRPPGFAC